jgi:AmiR/NasT family two-component response regulator
MTNTKIQLDAPVRSLLLVEDDRLIISTLTTGLKKAGYNVNSAESVTEAESWLDSNERPDLVLLDVHMPDRSGLELTKRLEELHHIPFILLTAHSEQEIIIQATESGAMGYMVKPVDITQLIPAIETAISRANELQDLRVDKKKLQEVLDNDRSVNVAVGIIMDQRGIGREDALNEIRKTARSNHISLITLAGIIVKSRENLNLQIDM